MRARPASEIPVAAFRQIFQWPLVLRIDREAGPATDGIAWHVDNTAEELAKAAPFWTEIDDPLFSPDDATVRGSYEEFVYFHDFTQRFLYPTPEDAPPVFRLWTSRYIRWIEADVGGRTHRFSVDRLTLHLFRLGAAVLTLEVASQPPSGRPLSLADVQTVIDRLRRSYAPYWDDPGTEAAGSPTEVRLRDVQDRIIGKPSQPLARNDALDALKRDRDAPVYDHWRELIWPLTIGRQPGQWRDPSDERVPCLSYISLTRAHWDPAACLEAVREGDWVRLADADGAGSDAHACNPDFVREPCRTAFYDRFFPHAEMRGTAARHLFGGAHYAVVGAGWFFDTILLRHFRRHYAQLALIARFEMAMLLAFSSRITQAVADRDRPAADDRPPGASQVLAGLAAGRRACPRRSRERDRHASFLVRRLRAWNRALGPPVAAILGRPRPGTAEARFEDAILDIQNDFLTFTHRFHFTGVSSQIQAAEMHDRWCRSLGLRELYADVRGELESAAAAVRSAQAQRAAEESTQLTRIATWGVVLGLIVGALGANIFVGTADGAALAALGDWGQLGLVSTLVLFGMGVLYRLLGRRREGGIALKASTWLAALTVLVTLATCSISTPADPSVNVDATADRTAESPLEITDDTEMNGRIPTR